MSSTTLTIIVALWGGLLLASLIYGLLAYLTLQNYQMNDIGSKFKFQLHL